MKRYSCPICDRRMKGQYYCSFCRQFVKDAYETKADYYLNERHPESEASCTYHNGSESHAGEKRRPQSEGRPPTGSQPRMEPREQGSYRSLSGNKALEERRIQTERQIQTEIQKPVGQFRINLPENGKKSSTGASAIGWVMIAIVFIVNFFASCST